MYKKTSKSLILIICITMLFSLININIHAAEVTSGMYYQSFIFPQADKYVEDNIGKFINSESKITPLNIEDIKVGHGIYVADKDAYDQLPTFYYPVYVNEALTYVFRVFDPGTKTYEGVFSKNYASEILSNAGNSYEDAPLWTANNGNEIILTKSNKKVIFDSKFGDSPERINLPDYLRNRSISINTIDVSEEVPFKTLPQSRAGYWVRDISYVETQGSNSWCAAYVTAAAIREMSATRSMRASTIMSYFGKGTSDSCTDSMISQYSAKYGIAYSGRYLGAVINSQSIYNELEKWNLVYGSYESGSAGHALLIHGVDGNTARIWNPWYKYSEWTSISVYYGGGRTWSMRGYGYFR